MICFFVSFFLSILKYFYFSNLKLIKMKKLLITGIGALGMVFMFTIGGIQAQDSELEGDKPKCKNGERCPSGTYNYCDTSSDGYSCVCYNCN